MSYFNLHVFILMPYFFFVPLQTEPEFLFCGTSLPLDSDWHLRHHVYLQMYGMLRLTFLSTKLCREQKLDNCLPC